MLRIIVATVLILAAAANAKPAAPLPYYPCNTTTRGMSTLNLIKYSGTWYTVASTLPTLSNNTLTPNQIQAAINKELGCAKNRFNLTNANYLNITQDVTLRKPISDKTVFPPNTVYVNDNEARFPLPARAASEDTPDDAHWIVEAYNKAGTTEVDFFNIATDYKDWAIWYVCTSPWAPPHQVIKQWGVWSRSPKPYNSIKKLAFKSVARLAGIDIAFTDYLYDIPQDACF